MNVVDYLQFLEPVQHNVSRVYSTTSGILTVLIFLWCLNIVVGLTQKIFATGKAVGTFYHNYLQKYFRLLSKSIFNLLHKKQFNENSKSSDVSLI